MSDGQAALIAFLTIVAIIVVTEVISRRKAAKRARAAKHQRDAEQEVAEICAALEGQPFSDDSARTLERRITAIDPWADIGDARTELRDMFVKWVREKFPPFFISMLGEVDSCPDFNQFLRLEAKAQTAFSHWIWRLPMEQRQPLQAQFLAVRVEKRQERLRSLLFIGSRNPDRLEPAQRREVCVGAVEMYAELCKSMPEALEGDKDIRNYVAEVASVLAGECEPAETVQLF